MGHDEKINFFSGADIELARFILQSEGSGSGSGPHAYADRPSGFQVAGHIAEMYEVFTCGDQMMDQIAQGYLAARGSEAPVMGSVDVPLPCTQSMLVYRPEPPIQFTRTQGSSTRVFSIIISHHSHSSIIISHHPINNICSHHLSPSSSISHRLSSIISRQFSLSNTIIHLHTHHTIIRITLIHYHSALEPSTHEVVRPRAQRPHRHRQPPHVGHHPICTIDQPE
ncbi:hypothetical protein PIB30_072649, partial [Stylosanthes scabra]|nr:hypothetical protein [Stylosanthes scabra]